jgi:hypothetical protein
VLLSDYQTQVTDLIHDPNNQIWSLNQLNKYINEARNRICVDTWCLRQILTPDIYSTLFFPAGTEFINPQSFLPSAFGPILVGTLGITVIINNRRLALQKRAYTYLSARYRQIVGQQAYPAYWGVVSPTQYVIAPIPSQQYTCEWDIAVTPTALAGTQGEIDQVPVPFQDAVQYFASYKAKVNQQQFQEAQMFLQLYGIEARRLAAAFRPMLNPYPEGR